jgi:ABC-2 type transport system permease protein
MRRILCTTGLVAALVAGLTGCSSAITADRLEPAVRTSFAKLFVLQQHQRGLQVDGANLNATADCGRGTASGATTGPGDDWVCNLTWRTRAATTGGAVYSINVKPDGCFTADGDGPADLNRSPTVVDVDGTSVINPLWAFDGCFSLS